MKRLCGMIGITGTLTLFLSAPASAQETVVDFESRGAGCSAAIPNGYAGFNWTGWGTCDTTLGTPGTVAAIISGEIGAFNFNGGNTVISGSPFNFIRAYLNSGWLTDLNITIVGKLGGNSVFEKTLFGLNAATSGAWYEFGYKIDELAFSAEAGGSTFESAFPSLYGGYVGTEFVMDDFTFTHTPEPSTVVLLATGLLGLGLYHRRRKRDLEG